MEGSLREEAVPLVGAKLGPRARVGRVDHTAEGEEADRGGRDETVERVNGREVYVWAAIDVDTGELPAMKATWSSGPGAPWTRSSSEGARGLHEQPVFVWRGPVVLVGLPGARAAVLPRGVRGQEQG